MIGKGVTFDKEKDEQGFDPYDQCLTCKRRVGSHSYDEFENCLAAQGTELLPTRFPSLYGDDEE